MAATPPAGGFQLFLGSAKCLRIQRLLPHGLAHLFTHRLTRYFRFRKLTFQNQLLKMQNDAGEFVDLYVPRKCTASNRIIHAKDHASIQINIVDVDETTGRMLDTFKTYAICGDIRRMGESNDCIDRLAKKDGVLAKNF